jgi:type IV pilus assembly protein PilO
MKFLLEILRSRKKSVALTLVLLIANVALAVYLLGWLIPGNKALQSRWFEKRKLLTTGGGDLAAIYRQGISDLETFNTMVPVRKSFAREVGDIFELAANNGLTVSAVTYKPNPSSVSLLDYALSFSVAGKYAGVKSFIADLQRFKEMVVIDHFTLTGSRATEEYVDLKLNLTVYLRTGAL